MLVSSCYSKLSYLKGYKNCNWIIKLIFTRKKMKGSSSSCRRNYSWGWSGMFRIISKITWLLSFCWLNLILSLRSLGWMLWDCCVIRDTLSSILISQTSICRMPTYLRVNSINVSSRTSILLSWTCRMLIAFRGTSPIATCRDA